MWADRKSNTGYSRLLFQCGYDTLSLSIYLIMIPSPTFRTIVLRTCLALLLGGLPFAHSGFVPAAHAQRHPVELRGMFPVGGSQGATTQVTIGGMSLRHAQNIFFDRPGITAVILPEAHSSLPPATPDTDGNPNVVVAITVAKSVPPGVCHFRVVSPSGLSDVGAWMVGRDLPQTEEKQPHNDLNTAQVLTLPIAVNGHIAAPGEQDVYRVQLAAGQAFVAEAQSIRMGLPLDSLLTLRDANGQQVADNDDYYSSDSLLVYTPKTAGTYYLTLSSSDGQASPSHAYRLEMGVLPLLMWRYPAGAQAGQSANVTAMGINLGSNRSPAMSLPVPVNAVDGSGIARVFVDSAPLVSNSLPVLLSSLPALAEQEPNDSRPSAMSVAPPCLVNGRFWHEPQGKISPSASGNSKPDVDYFKFRGVAGQRYVIDVTCQQLGSPADPIVTLLGPDDKPIAENDDTSGRDSHLDVVLPASGEYALRVAESRSQFRPENVYCLTLQTPSPGFTLATETRERAVGQGDVVPLEVTVTRDRWDGPIALSIRDLPPGVTASTCIVPPGVGKGLLLLSADKAAPLTAFALRIAGTAQVGGKTVERSLESAADWEWKNVARFNVPTPSNLPMFAVREPFEITPTNATTALSLTRGASATLSVKLTRQPGYSKPVTLRVLGLPDGVTAADVAIAGDKSEGAVELKAAPTARLGATPITVSCVVSQSQFVQLDRATPAITLTVTEPPKK